MRNFLITISLLFVVSMNQNGQNMVNDNILKKVQEEYSNTGNVRIILDEGIEDNYFKHLIFSTNQPEVLGYRIRIFSGSGQDARKRALTARATFHSKYPEIGTYLDTRSFPDYKVYVGDCRTRAEVVELFEKVEKDFPQYNPFITPLIEINLEKYKSSTNNE